jgi:hypothetical protein
MATLPKWKFAGGTTTVIDGLEDSDNDLSQWYSRVVEFILRIVEGQDFQVGDNGYRRFPSVLVTEGVKCLFRGNPFEVWSDVAGELILRHEGMGFRLGNELIGRLEEQWE